MLWTLAEKWWNRIFQLQSPVNGGVAAADEDKDMQIDFLNSIIVDMQRKNDEYRAKIQILEANGIGDLKPFGSSWVAFLFIFTFNYIFRLECTIPVYLENYDNDSDHKVYLSLIGSVTMFK